MTYPDRKVLLDLAERSEQASAAGRWLDVLIGCAIGYVPDTAGCDWARDPSWQYVPVPKMTERIGCADKAGNVAAHWEAPAYTASLDAAMKLVPKGWAWLARGPSEGALIDPTKCFCRLESIDFKSVTYGKGSDWITDILSGQSVTAVATTPALAITAAALRARASLIPDIKD